MDIKISIKSMGFYFLIPILINDVIIPLIIFLIKINGTTDNVEQGVMILTQMFTPFLASFWVYMHLVKYIDAKGNENFYINNRNKWGEVLKLYLLYIFTNTIFFIWYASMGKQYFVEWIHIVIVSFFFVTAAYFLSYLFRSISLALIPTFIYMLASVTGLNDYLNKISFYESTGMRLSQLFTRYNYFLILAIVFAVLGSLLNKYYEEYND